MTRTAKVIIFPIVPAPRHNNARILPQPDAGVTTQQSGGRDGYSPYDTDKDPAWQVRKEALEAKFRDRLYGK